MSEIVDVSKLSDDDLAALLDAARAEAQKRRALREAQDATPDLSEALQAVLGRSPGDEWEQPLGAHDAYPEGWEVGHGGKRWVSLLPANVYEPGDSGWRELPDEDGTPPEWVQPSGAHDTYRAGEMVTFDGAIWMSDVDNNAWQPGDYGWTKQA